MRYLMLMRPGALPEAPGALPDRAAVAARMKYNEALKKAGVLLAVEGLHGTSKGARISKSVGRRHVVNGPFPESNDLVAGFWLIQVKSRQEAVEWASRCPLEEGQTIELRLAFELSDLAPELISPNPNPNPNPVALAGPERTTTMRFLLIPVTLADDAPVSQQQAREPFDEATFIAHMKYNEEMHEAGVLITSEGLNPGPRSAHIRMSRDGKRTVLDGPYAETKELIAGFWLLEVDSREEAIKWALRCPQTPGKDEVIEIRALTGEGDLPAELVGLIRKSAPKWSASFASLRR